MGEQTREYPLVSACGLNCGLCPNHYTKGAFRCPGCGGKDFFNPACAILKCNARHGAIEFCFLCPEYPCGRYAAADASDSFITHRNQLRDNAKLQKYGFAAYQAELWEKMEILQALLDIYNDGRRKSFYCVAVNLLPPQELRAVMGRLACETGDSQTLKEKAKYAALLLGEAAQKAGISLKLRKK
ncbi:MAG TPA: hypothetical protein DEB31_00070 [Clostridiales bacterium]|nr:hypothetical protein [Clostridiales bacterium]